MPKPKRIRKHRKQGTREWIERKLVRFKIIPAKPVPYDLEHPVIVEARERLELVNDSMWGHVVRCTDWQGEWKEYRQHDLQARFTYDPDRPGDAYQLHGRNYTLGTEYQAMRKTERRRCYIDDDPTVEFDYKCLHARLAYNLLGLPCPDDCYRFLGPGDDNRLLAKKILNTALNAESENAANGSFISAMRHWNHDRPTQAYKRARALYDAYHALGKPRPTELYQRLCEHHAAIQNYFTTDAGMKLMWHEARLAREVMYRLMQQGIPVLCFHDSFLVPQQHGSELKRLMIQEYSTMFGFEPEVDQK